MSTQVLVYTLCVLLCTALVIVFGSLALAQNGVGEDYISINLAFAQLGDDYVRAWHFDDGRKDWTFYDPRPAFAKYVTLNEVAKDRSYSIKVKNGRDLVLFGTRHRLNAGWNEITLTSAAGGGGRVLPPTPETPTPTIEHDRDRDRVRPSPDNNGDNEPEPPSPREFESLLGDNIPAIDANATSVLGFVPPEGCETIVYPEILGLPRGVIPREVNEALRVCFTLWNENSPLNLILSDPEGQIIQSDTIVTDRFGDGIHRLTLLNGDPIGSYQLAATQPATGTQPTPQLAATQPETGTQPTAQLAATQPATGTQPTADLVGLLTVTLSETTQPRVGVRPYVVAAGNDLEIGMAGFTRSAKEDLLFYRECTITIEGKAQLPACIVDSETARSDFVFVGWIPSVPISEDGEARLIMSTKPSDPRDCYQVVIQDSMGEILTLAEFSVATQC